MAKASLRAAWEYLMNTRCMAGDARPDEDPMWLSATIAKQGFKPGYVAVQRELEREEILAAHELEEDDNTNGDSAQFERLLHGLSVNREWVQRLAQACEKDVLFEGHGPKRRVRAARCRANLRKLQTSVAALGSSTLPLPACVEECFTSWAALIALHLRESRPTYWFEPTDLGKFLEQILPYAGCVRFWPLAQREGEYYGTDTNTLNYSLDVEGRCRDRLEALAALVEQSRAAERYAKARADQLRSVAQLDTLKAIAREVVAEDPEQGAFAPLLAKLDPANFSKKLNKRYASHLRRYCVGPSGDARAKLRVWNVALQLQIFAFPAFDRDEFFAGRAAVLGALRQIATNVSDAITEDEALRLVLPIRNEKVKRKALAILEQTVVLLPMEKHLQKSPSLECAGFAARIGSLALKYCAGMNSEFVDERISHFKRVMAQSLVAYKRTRSEFLASSYDRQRDLNDVPLLPKLLSLCERFSTGASGTPLIHSLLNTWFTRFSTVGMTNNFITAYNAAEPKWKLPLDIADDIWEWNYNGGDSISASDAHLLAQVFTVHREDMVDYLKYYGIDREVVLRATTAWNPALELEGEKPKKKMKQDDDTCLPALHDYFASLADKVVGAGHNSNKRSRTRIAQELLRVGQCRMGSALFCGPDVTPEARVNIMSSTLKVWSKKLFLAVASKSQRCLYRQIRLFGYVWNMIVSLLLIGTTESERADLAERVSSAVAYQCSATKIANVLLDKLHKVLAIVEGKGKGVSKLRRDHLILGTVANALVRELTAAL